MMLENNAKKPPTDFTIDCILSKPLNQNGETPKTSATNHPMNKVLANPWKPKCPLSLTYNPSSHRKPNYQPPDRVRNFFNLHDPLNLAENLIKISPPVTLQSSSLRNHFYPAVAASSSITSNNTNHSDGYKFNLHDTKLCDKKIIHNNLSLSEEIVVKSEIPSPTTPNFALKCSVCSKTFESIDILNVSFVI